VEEVFVFADNGHIVQLGVAADFAVGRLCESNLQDMTALVASRGDEAREAGWELVVHQEFHEAFRIG
jgi:hypothetical protein